MPKRQWLPHTSDVRRMKALRTEQRLTNAAIAVYRRLLRVGSARASLRAEASDRLP